MRPVAVVINLFYTGLGIARSLGEHGVSVIGLTSKQGVYGNYTRYAKVVSSPDSRTEPEALRDFLLNMSREFSGRAVIFPTRDDDLVFLDRFRVELAPYYSAVMPESTVLNTCLNKWETYLAADAAGIPVPRCWMITASADIARVIREVTYPCVLKPVCAHHWRQGANWELVGSRKAVGVSSEEEFLTEYQALARADQRVLVQEMVAGSDQALLIAACYLDRSSKWVAGFNTQKLLQVPPGFGTGCIVQGVDCPELFEPTRRLLEGMRYSGVAEVEYKWDAVRKEYKLIEINPRPWDQHRLGNACGVELMYLAYCDHAGLPVPRMRPAGKKRKWIAEDTFFIAGLRFLWNRDPILGSMFRLARGKRIYAIWSWKDPLPFLSYLFTTVPRLAWTGIRRAATSLLSRVFRQSLRANRGFHHESQCKDASSRIG